jgi:hypothetical protein
MYVGTGRLGTGLRKTAEHDVVNEFINSLKKIYASTSIVHFIGIDNRMTSIGDYLSLVVEAM